MHIPIDLNIDTQRYKHRCTHDWMPSEGMPVNLAPYYCKTIRDSKKVIKNKNRMKLIHGKLYFNKTVGNLRERLTEIQVYNQKKKKDIRGDIHTQDFFFLSFWVFLIGAYACTGCQRVIVLCFADS